MTRHCRPVTFGTLEDAARAVDEVRRATRDRRRPYIPYQCGTCGGFHIERRPPFNYDNPDDHRRAALVDAGWTQISNAGIERWMPPRHVKRRKANSRSRARRTLDQAWAMHLRYLALQETEPAAA